MKKLGVFLAAVVCAFGALVGCGTKLPASPYLDASVQGTALYATGNCTITINPNKEKGQEALLDYMGKKDIVYIDARNFADYDAGHIEGFECIPFFAWIMGADTQLFKSDFTPRYEDSVEMMRKLLPEGKTIFLMCQSGGRIQSFMACLKNAGYDMSKIYNVGGWGQVATAKTAGIVYPTSK